MDVKYTFRDLVVYLLTGIATMLLIFIAKPDIVDYWLQNKECNKIITFLKTKDTLLVIAAIPIAYLVGHIIQILDLLISYRLTKFFKKVRDKYKDKKAVRAIFHALYWISGSTTVEYQRAKIMEEQQSRNETPLLEESVLVSQQYAVSVYDKNNPAGYSYLLKELFNGLRSFLLIFIPYMVVTKWHTTQHLILFFSYSFLLLFFWIKAENAAYNFVYAITNTYQAIKAKNTQSANAT